MVDKELESEVQICWFLSSLSQFEGFSLLVRLEMRTNSEGKKESSIEIALNEIAS